MGKSNKAQRTKGNARPSNSSHSAQLLSLSGKTINGFIGFDGLEKDKASYVPVTGQQISDSCDSCVDSDFRMVMRKMLKRDAVTRLKAVQEFSEYCDEKDSDAVKNVLPFWPRLFNKLALDTDRRIREATHQANGKIILKVKRDIAPYLKSIMGVWLLGQCDLYAPSASAAQTTFSKTFPPPKQSDAIAHCKSEIFIYFKDNLFEQTAKTLSDPSFTSTEDMENKYILVISGTLQALKLLLNTMQPKDHANIREDFYSLVAENKFWKFPKNKEALIRGSWFALIGSLCQTMHNVFNEMENKLTTTVFGSLSESDPIVAPSVWEAVLSIVVNFENCWQSVNINKLVLPQLWTLLKDGGKGNAQMLFPCLLPFMSKLPNSIIEDQNFLLRFFSSLEESLFLDNVKLSHMECDAILTAFMECLQYICCVRLDNIDICSTLLEKILLNEVVPMVDSSLYSRDTHLAVSKLYPLLGSLIRKLENECLSRKDRSGAFANVLGLFWNNLLPTTCKVFSLKDQKKIEAVLYLSYFYNSMIIPSDTLVKSEKSKVKFEDEVSETDNVNQDYSVIAKTVESGIFSLSNKNTMSFSYIVKFSQCLCENITEKFDIHYLNLLAEILGSAQTAELFKELISALSSAQGESEHLTLFLKQFVFKWLEQVGKDIPKLNSIVELIFIICSYVSEKEALDILNMCSEVGNCSLLQCFLCKGLKKPSCIFQEWLKNSVFASNFVADIQDAMKKAIYDDDAKENDCKVLLNILEICLTAKMLEKPIINNKNLETILEALKYFAEELFTLDIEKLNNLQYGLDFLCNISICILKNSKVCWNFKAIEDLLILIFHQSLTSKHLFRNLSQVWIAAIESYIFVKAEIIHDNSFILKIATKLHSALLSSTTIDESSHVLNHCFGLFSAVQESLILQKAKLQYSALFALYKLMDIVLPTDYNWCELKEGLTLGTTSILLKKQLFYPLYLNDDFQANESKIQKLSVVCNIVSRIIIQELDRTNTLADQKFFESYIVKHLPQILWFIALCEGNNASNMVSENLSVTNIVQDCVKMVSFLSNRFSEIVNEIYESSHFCCIDWALPFRIFLQFCYQIQPQIIPNLINEMAEKMNLAENMNKYVLHQIAVPYLSEEKCLFYLKTSLLEISQMQDLSNEDFAGKLGEICCCLQKEVNITKDLQDIILEAVCKVVEYNFEDEHLEFVCNLQIIEILSSMLKYGPAIFTQNILDYCMATLNGYLKIGYLIEYKNPKALLELHEMSSIFAILSSFRSNHDSSECQINLELPSFNDEFYRQMISLYLDVANTFNICKPLPEMCFNVLSSISEAMEFLPSEYLVKAVHEGHELPGVADNSIFQALISSLTFNIRQIQFISHSLLLKIMKHLPNTVQNTQKTLNDEDKDEDIEKIPICLMPLVNLLTFLTEIVESMLSDFKIGDLCVVLPETDAYVYTMAYLLSWIEMLEFISSSPSQVRSIYATHLEENILMSKLFSCVFRLMPCNPMLCLKKGLNVETPKKDDLKLLFISPVLNSDSPSSEEIQTIASYVFATSLRKVPASIRTWWNNLDRKSSDIVNRYTTKYISGLLCIEEIQAVHESEKQFENMVVQARPGSREVIATYTIDDCAIELSVQLPANYPLGPISAERRGKIVIGQLEWRHWLMQLTTVLRYQNGSILDGLNIWKRNLDKKFEGVEECMICYYILHSSTLKLPKLSCRICKKKFHSACLYKWFDTSYNSTCPLCRNEFLNPM